MVWLSSHNYQDADDENVEEGLVQNFNFVEAGCHPPLDVITPSGSRRGGWLTSFSPPLPSLPRALPRPSSIGSGGRSYLWTFARGVHVTLTLIPCFSCRNRIQFNLVVSKFLSEVSEEMI